MATTNGIVIKHTIDKSLTYQTNISNTSKISKIYKMFKKCIMHIKYQIYQMYRKYRVSQIYQLYKIHLTYHRWKTEIYHDDDQSCAPIEDVVVSTSKRAWTLSLIVKQLFIFIIITVTIINIIIPSLPPPQPSPSSMLILQQQKRAFQYFIWWAFEDQHHIWKFCRKFWHLERCHQKTFEFRKEIRNYEYRAQANF